MLRQRFGAAVRLNLRQEYEALLGSKPVGRSRRFLVHVLPNAYSIARLGIIVSKRTVPRATRRNRLKRWVREAFRHQQAQLAGLDLLVRVREDATREEGLFVRQELTRLFSSLSK